MDHSSHISLQVNLHFSPSQICGAGTMVRGKDNAITIQPVMFYAQNIPSLLKKIKRVYDIPRENVTLTFQPECL